MSDDEAPITKKKSLKKTIVDDSDDDAPKTKKSSKLKKKQDSDSDEDPAPKKKGIGKKKATEAAKQDDDEDVPTTKKSKETHVDPEGVSILDNDAAPTTAAASSGIIAFPPVDYDSMSYDQFLKHLESKSKMHRFEEWRRHEESKVQSSGAADEDDDGKTIQRFTDGSGGYAYKVLLDRVMGKIGPGGDVQVKIPAPQIERFGSKRTVIVNFEKMCQHLHRDGEDVKDFIEKQLTIQSSIDSNGCWVGRVQNVKVSQIENIFQKYIAQYVQCLMCFSIDTELSKDHSTRLTTMKCHKCKATRTVTSQGTATYQATTIKRSKLRAKAAM